MNTKEQIVQLGNQLIRDKGFNGFSFYDISKKLQIKNASIHYYFPTKTDLGVSILKNDREKIKSLIQSTESKNPLEKLKIFLSVYTKIQMEGKVCIVGSLATDLKTLEPKVTKELKLLAQEVLAWVTSILEEGKKKKVFSYQGNARTKALMIITNMLAAVQVCRLTSEKDFYSIQETIIKELKV